MDDPNNPSWLASVRESQSPTSVEVEGKLRVWLENGTLPTLRLWHGRHLAEGYTLPDGGLGGGDCELTSFALYKDLRQTKLDAEWTLVGGELASVGRHYFNVYRSMDGEAQAVNVNLGSVRVIPLEIYLAANGCTDLYPLVPKYLHRIYAMATRLGDARTSTVAEAVAADKLFSKAFGMPHQLPADMHRSIE